MINALQRGMFVHSRVRVILLKLAGAQIADSVSIGALSYFGSPKLTLKDGVVTNIGCFFDGCAHITVGERVRFGPYVKILTGTHPVRSSVYRRKAGENINQPVTIERGSWIGMGAIIMPGVTIAEGCVVAAGAVVTRSTEPNGLYAGNPAVRKKDLSTEEDMPPSSSVIDH
jgi:maltose O-acetyltransferase